MLLTVPPPPLPLLPPPSPPPLPRPPPRSRRPASPTCPPQAMRVMNRRLNLPNLQNIMREFERQNERMEMTSEMMGDAVDDALQVPYACRHGCARISVTTHMRGCRRGRRRRHPCIVRLEACAYDAARTACWPFEDGARRAGSRDTHMPHCYALVTTLSVWCVCTGPDSP